MAPFTFKSIFFFFGFVIRGQMGQKWGLFCVTEIKKMVAKNMELKNINTKFIKAKYGDASGVRGAARLNY